MSRKKTINQSQLFHETENLIMESGYSGFHYKALSERLGVARSTIYNYYSRKEELITAYMVHLIEEAVAEMKDAETAENPVKALLHIWAKYARMHQMMQIMPYIDHHATKQVEENIRRMYALFSEMKKKIEQVLHDGQKEGSIRTDVKMRTLTGLFMATVQVPVHHDTMEEWVEEVYELVMHGFQN